MSPVTPTMSARTQCAFGLLGFSSEAIGPAATIMATVSGTTMMMVQVSSAEVMTPTRAFSAGSRPARSADLARIGTIALVSAPPRISSYSRLGTWFAVTYAVPRQVAPTVCENTSVRTRPRIRDRMVRLATMRAPRVMPSASREGGSVTPAGPVLLSSLVCTCNFWSLCMRGLRPVRPLLVQNPNSAANRIHSDRHR